MKFNHVGIPTNESFAGEIPLTRLKVTVSDHRNNPFGIQWQRYWDDAAVPELVKTVAHVAFEVDDLESVIAGRKILIAPRRSWSDSEFAVQDQLSPHRPGIQRVKRSECWSSWPIQDFPRSRQGGRG